MVVLADKVNAALHTLLPAGAATACWGSVAESTRPGYLRSLRKWLQFAGKHGCSVTTPDPVNQAAFVESLTEKESGDTIKSTLSGIRSICSMFNVEWTVEPVI